MWDVWTEEHHIAYVKALDAVANNSFTIAFGHKNQFTFRMEVKRRIEIRITSLNDGDLIVGKCPHFNKNGFHVFISLSILLFRLVALDGSIQPFTYDLPG
jgi:hypothetical protein